MLRRFPTSHLRVCLQNPRILPMVASTRRSSRLPAAREAIELPAGPSQSPRIGEKRKRTSDESKDLDESETEHPKVEKATKKTRQTKPVPTYIIPDVLHKETTFKGRLGWLFPIRFSSRFTTSRLRMSKHRVEEQETGQGLHILFADLPVSFLS